jgi:hypothetical protein
MNHQNPLPLLALSALSLLAACGGDGGSAAPAPAAELAKFMLANDPGPALGVLASKEKGADEHASVVGRIANIVKGYAVFTLMDIDLPYCGEVEKNDRCLTPWDYCCEQPATRTANSLVVELRDAAGKPIRTAALPDLRLLDAVKVQGALSKDADGNFVVAATGLFRTQRPELAANVRWPQ